MRNQSHDVEVYDLVRRPTGKIIHSFPAGGRQLIYICNGIPTMLPVQEDELVATLQAFIEASRAAGFQVIPAAE